MRDLVGLVVKVLVVGALVIGAVAGIVLLKRNADDHRASRGSIERVSDPRTGVSWDMYGTPTLEETTSDLILDAAAGVEIPVRIYTVDHGDWVERVQVFEVPPGEIDFTQAALSTFDANIDGELRDIEFITVAGFDGATGSTDGTVVQKGERREVDSQVFASQIRATMVTGGVARRPGTDSVDVAEDAQTLWESVEQA
ncbi:MAG: hypothetical protein KDA98_01915 [Acidimicrobiales bacterium]|nr:hypothetical protein [Acidimicrobiales bacterium]